jgi:hypothetical protein
MHDLGSSKLVILFYAQTYTRARRLHAFLISIMQPIPYDRIAKPPLVTSELRSYRRASIILWCFNFFKTQ